MKRKLIRLLSAMLVLVLTAGLLPSFASAAEPQAKDVAAAYLNVLKSVSQINIQSKHQVRFYDVNGDAVPEMIVLSRPFDDSYSRKLSIWTYQNGGIKKLFERQEAVEVAGGQDFWVYLLADGRLGWYLYGVDAGYWYYGTYYTAGSNGLYTESGSFDRYHSPDDSTGKLRFRGSINGKTATEAAVKAEENKMLSGTMIFSCTRPESDETGQMTLSEARSFLNGIKGRFWDVPSNAFYTNPVNWAVQNKVTSGRDALHFAPDETVMRSEAMTFLWAAKGKPAYSTKKSPFKDVKKKDWFYGAVLWAIENKITSGTDATHFSPRQTCGRSEILQFLYATMGKPGYTIKNPYSDVKKKHWYYDSAIWAYEKGLEKGESGKFNAKTPCTRAYVVTYLYRFITGRELVK